MLDFDLFISYRRQDATQVLPLVAALRQCGLSVWLDQDAIIEFAASSVMVRLLTLGFRELESPSPRPNVRRANFTRSSRTRT